MLRSRELTQLPSTLAKKKKQRGVTGSPCPLSDQTTNAVWKHVSYVCFSPVLFFFFLASACTATVRFHLVSTVGGLPLPSVKPKNCCVDLKMSRTLRSHGGGTRSARGPKFILGLGFNFDHSLPENRPWKSPPVPLLLLAVLNCKGSDS